MLSTPDVGQMIATCGFEGVACRDSLIFMFNSEPSSIRPGYGKSNDSHNSERTGGAEIKAR